jgi:hypothetical protein
MSVKVPFEFILICALYKGFDSFDSMTFPVIICAHAGDIDQIRAIITYKWVDFFMVFVVL